MKFLPMTLSAAVALAVAQMAAAQPSVIAPRSGNTTVEQNGVQNSNQVGSGNQSTQTYGSGNQTSATQGD